MASGHNGGSFFIESRWKEEVVYWEDSRGFLFDAGWGKDPLTLYVPSQRIWDMVVPDWMRGRRAEIVDRLEAHSGHRLMDDDAGYDWFDAQDHGPSPHRILSR